MKKFISIFMLAFLMSPILNAATASRVCHSMAKAVADDSGTEGEAYADKYMATYNSCELMQEPEEEIADGH